MILGSRQFSMEDQHRFAALSGDFNPIHVDALAARRTAAGAPVVHGVHVLCWALDLYASVAGTERALSGLNVQFSRFVLVGNLVDLRVVERPESVQLRIEQAGLLLSLIRLDFGASKRKHWSMPTALPAIYAPDKPLDTVAAVPGVGGQVPFARSPAETAKAFPYAASWTGGSRLAALGASTRLVGMILPGAHSVYVDIDLMLSEVKDDDHLLFAVQSVRHGIIKIDVDGGGLRGTIQCIARAQPARQPGLPELQDTILGKPFVGAHALVVGGSRGLGELTAKLIAVGGGDVTITYNVGHDEAAAVAAEINSHGGGRCDILPLQIGDATADQVRAIANAPSHLYYFAAPSIAASSSTFLDFERLARFNRIFVDGFWIILSALRAHRPDLRLFYPSTSYIDDRPKGMAEYVMAKAAAELLCAEVNATLAPTSVVFARLPPLATDQTAGMSDLASSVDTLLPFVLETQRPAP